MPFRTTFAVTCGTDRVTLITYVVGRAACDQGSAMPKDVLLESVGDQLFVSINGIRIARRVDPDISQAGIWIPLKPGWSVLDSANDDDLIVSVDGVRVH